MKGEGLNLGGMEKGDIVKTENTDLLTGVIPGVIPGIDLVPEETPSHLIDQDLETADILLGMEEVVPETILEIGTDPAAGIEIILNQEIVPEITTKRVVQNTTNPVAKGVPHPTGTRKTKKVQ